MQTRVFFKLAVYLFTIANLSIRGVKDIGLDPIYLTVKPWYDYLLENMVTTREIDQEGRREKIPNRSEEHSPGILWGESYRLARLHGLQIHDLTTSRLLTDHSTFRLQTIWDNRQRKKATLVFPCELS